MSQEIWSGVDRYFGDLLAPSDAVLEAALRASEEAGLPAIQVSALQGKMLQLLARIRGAARILEMGTLGGYSTLWLARALPPGGRLVTLELDPRHAAVAQKNFARAGLAEVIEIRVGPASASLARMIEEKAEPFDMIFIDADKPGYPDYFTQALRLSRPGTLIVADNVVRKGAVAEAASSDPAVRGVRAFAEKVAAHPEVSSTVIQTVGNKGYDGFLLAWVAGSR